MIRLFLRTVGIYYIIETGLRLMMVGVKSQYRQEGVIRTKRTKGLLVFGLSWHLETRSPLKKLNLFNSILRQSCNE